MVFKALVLSKITYRASVDRKLRGPRTEPGIKIKRPARTDPLQKGNKPTNDSMCLSGVFLWN